MLTTPAQSTQPITSDHVMPSRSKWAGRITAAWQQQVPSIFATAELLESAKADLRHGDYMKMVKADLPFSQSTANKLMKIAACDHLRNSDHGPILPACWRTLFELTHLTAVQFDRGIQSGAINPKMQRRAVKALRGAEEIPKRATPMALLKRQLNDLLGEIAHLQEQLARADQGSLFDLHKDSVKDIAATMVSSMTATRALAIADAIKRAVKEKKAAEL